MGIIGCCFLGEPLIARDNGSSFTTTRILELADLLFLLFRPSDRARSRHVSRRSLISQSGHIGPTSLISHQKPRRCPRAFLTAMMGLIVDEVHDRTPARPDDICFMSPEYQKCPRIVGTFIFPNYEFRLKPPQQQDPPTNNVTARMLSE